MKPSVLVLGATGFLGGHVARQFDTAGFDVHGTRRATSEAWHVADVDLTWHEADLDEPDTLDEPLQACQVVVDCAAFYPTQGVDTDAALRRGVGRLRRVLDGCRRHRIQRIVFTSSPVTLGTADVDEGEDGLSEEDFYVPGSVENAYFETKFSMEAEVYRYVNDGLPVMIAIPGAVFGPGDIKPTTGEFLVRLADGKLPAYVEGTFNAVDVRDVAESLVAMVETGRPGRRYVLGGHNLAIGPFVRQAAEACGVEPPSHKLPGGPVRQVARLAERAGRAVGYSGDSPLIGVDLMYYARPLSSERAEAELGHQPRMIGSTLRDTIDWFRSHDYFDDAAT